MQNENYPPPVNTLLSYGEAPLQDWPDYLAMGLGPEHVPDLVRMARDTALHEGSPGSLEVWAPVHAWRALGQLQAEAAVEPLLALLRRIDEDDDEWVGADLPTVFGMIGAAAIPGLTAYLADPSNPTFARAAAGNGLIEIAVRHPETHDACVAAISGQVEHFAEQDEELNGMLIADLIDLDAVEAAPVMERAFAAGAVDEMVAGDWDDVRIELGLLDERETPREGSDFPDLQRAVDAMRAEAFSNTEHWSITPAVEPEQEPPGPGSAALAKARAKEKAKAKRLKQQQRKERQKKKKKR